MSARRIAVVLITAVTVAGCGGGRSDDGAAIRKAVAAWGRADTPAAVCAAMTTGFRSRIAGTLAEDPQTGRLGKAADCVKKVTRKLGPFSAVTLHATKVEIHGSQATVVITQAAPRLLLRKVAGRWGIDGFTPAPGS